MTFSSIQRQKGVVLFIALIALIAMMAAAVSLSYSVDTGGQFSTNRMLAFSAQSAADVGYAKAKADILKIIDGKKFKSRDMVTALKTKSGCYFPYAFRGSFRNGDTSFASDMQDRLNGVDPQGIPMRLTDSSPQGACSFDLDKTREKVYYIMDLQCPTTDDTNKSFDADCSYPNNLTTGSIGDSKVGLVTVTQNPNNQTDEVTVIEPGAALNGRIGLGWQGAGVKINDVNVPTFSVPLIRVSVRVDGSRGTRVYRQQMISLFQNPAKTQ